MNYYKRHLGDYAKKTKMLTTYEHGVYNQILDQYYIEESPGTTEDAYVLCRADSIKDRASVDKVLTKYFELIDGVWRHSRADEEIEKYRLKAEKNRAIGSLGGKQNAKRNSTETLSESLQERLANDTPSHKPLANSHKKANTPIVPTGDSAAVIEAYHRILPGCQQIAVLNDKRKKRIAAAVKLAKSVCDGQGWPYVAADFWSAYFTECSHDAWMRGEVPNPKNPAWRQNLDVLLAEDRFAGVMDRAIASMRGAV